MKKIFIFLGPPGSGKGTQAQFFSKKNSNFLHISTGDLLRRSDEFLRTNTSVINQGGLVDDATVCKLVVEKLDKVQSKEIILDGFPRTLVQAEFLNDYVKKAGFYEVIVVYFTIEVDLVVERVSNRLTCELCGWVQSKNNMETRPLCQKCSSDQLIKRQDDNKETISLRFEQYENETKPLLGFYKNKGLSIFSINAALSVEKVTAQVSKAILAA